MDTILIVEDEALLRESLADLLAMNGYTVQTAKNGLEGLGKLRDLDIDLVLCDITMPVMDGYEFVKAVRASKSLELLPIIFLTARIEFASKLKGLELGIDDYITKPFEFRELKLKMRNLLHRQKKQAAQQVEPAPQGAAIPADTMFLKQLQLVLSEQMANSNLTTTAVASHMHMSLSTFSRHLKRLTGKVPNQYIREVRLERARQMIASGYGNITEIALACGFASLSYFSTCYKEQYGHSPGSEPGEP